MNSNSPRLRFAPSPTGYLHVGGLRTALYNFFIAKHFSGSLVLRIEDTDQNRLVENAEENLIKMLKWAGVNFDEGPHISNQKYGPYRQSERLHIYKKYYLRLIEKQLAYPCIYSADRINDLATGKITSEHATIEDEIYKDFILSEVLEKMKKEKFVVRLKIPKNESIEYTDLVKGTVKFDLNLISDPILIKSDGFPTYHFANVIDDHLMKITHVVRGEEWLPSIPKHIVLYNSLGWEKPQFAHLPLLLNDDKSKLSKRKNDVSIESYIDKGYTKEALVNFLSLLGWHEKGDKEIYNFNELINSFSLDRVNKSGAIFDVQKLNSFNNYYIKNYETNQLKLLLVNFVPKSWELTDEIIDLVKDKAVTLADFKNLLQFLFEDIILTEQHQEIINLDISQKICKSFLDEFNNKKPLKIIAQNVQQNTSCTPKEFWNITRISLTGNEHGPSLDAILKIYGSTKVNALIKNVLKKT